MQQRLIRLKKIYIYLKNTKLNKKNLKTKKRLLTFKDFKYLN